MMKNSAMIFGPIFRNIWSFITRFQEGNRIWHIKKHTHTHNEGNSFTILPLHFSPIKLNPAWIIHVWGRRNMGKNPARNVIISYKMAVNSSLLFCVIGQQKQHRLISHSSSAFQLAGRTFPSVSSSSSVFFFSFSFFFFFFFFCFFYVSILFLFSRTLLIGPCFSAIQIPYLNEVRRGGK